MNSKNRRRRLATLAPALSMTTAILLLVAAAPAAAQNPPTSEYDVPSDADIHYIDLDDAGDDPWNPGCHWHYGNDECSAPEFFFMGDYCSPDGRTLYEWTNDRCHEPEDDLEEYNCNKLCEQKYGTSGSCVVAKKHCLSRQVKDPEATLDSASCVCQEEAG